MLAVLFIKEHAVWLHWPAALSAQWYMINSVCYLNQLGARIKLLGMFDFFVAAMHIKRVSMNLKHVGCKGDRLFSLVSSKVQVFLLAKNG